ncbi:MAG: hypothetical protein ABEJ65_03965, partial [bacterium]
MNQSKYVLSVLSMLVVGFFFAATSAHALNFPIQGARSQGMGGAGVAEIADENAMTWNPANLNIRPTSFDAGAHASFQLQTTKDMQKELQDLEDFEQDVDSLDSIVEGSYNDTEA